LRAQGVGGGAVTLFYALLGVAVVLSSRIWAGLLDRQRGGGALARLNALLGLATVLPALTSAWPVALASGLLFGGVFLSVVASTTALVRHNLPPRSGRQASAPSPSCLRPGRSWGPRWWAGSLTALAAWRAAWCSRLQRSGWAHWKAIGLTSPIPMYGYGSTT
jgi:hypothetical protein